MNHDRQALLATWHSQDCPSAATSKSSNKKKGDGGLLPAAHSAPSSFFFFFWVVAAGRRVGVFLLLFFPAQRNKHWLSLFETAAGDLHRGRAFCKPAPTGCSHRDGLARTGFPRKFVPLTIMWLCPTQQAAQDANCNDRQTHTQHSTSGAYHHRGYYFFCDPRPASCGLRRGVGGALPRHSFFSKTTVSPTRKEDGNPLSKSDCLPTQDAAAPHTYIVSC